MLYGSDRLYAFRQFSLSLVFLILIWTMQLFEGFISLFIFFKPETAFSE